MGPSNEVDGVHMCRAGKILILIIKIKRSFSWGITKGVGVRGYGVILIWGLNMGKFQMDRTRHYWPWKTKCF